MSCYHRNRLSTNQMTDVTLLTAIYCSYAFGRERVRVLDSRSCLCELLEMTTTQMSFLPPCPRRERPNIIPSRSVCRQLFGPVNHEQMRADLLREKRKLCDENTRAWNFDFENGIPLVGRYVWERICSNLTREKPVSSLSDCVSETGSNERLACFNVPDPSAERTTTTTTCSGMTDCTISNDAESESLENAKCDPEKRLKHLRKRKSSGKITGELGCFCFSRISLRMLVWTFDVCSFRRLLTRILNLA